VRGLVVEFLVDLSAGFLEPFLGLRNRLFQLTLNLFSDFLLLKFCRCLGQSLFNLISDLLRGVPDPFGHTWIVRWFTLGQRHGT